MSLVSNLFLLFVAAAVIVYYLVPARWQWLVLLSFSYIYYIAGGIKYVGFLLFSTLVTWMIALLIEKEETAGKHKRARKFVILGLILNFGMLGLIKYTNFAVENLNALFHMNLRGDPASTGNFFLYFPVFRIYSGCILEALQSGAQSSEICIVCIVLSTDPSGTDRKV